MKKLIVFLVWMLCILTTFIFSSQSFAQSAQHLFVAQRGGDGGIYEYSLDGTFIGAFGQAQLDSPEDLVFDSNGNIYVTNAFDSSIKKFDRFGNFVDSFGFGALSPIGIAIYDDKLYVGDNGRYAVQVFGLDGTYLAEYGRDLSTAPRHVTVDTSGNIYLANIASPEEIRKFDTNGVPVDTFAEGYGGWGVEYTPDGNIMTGRSGIIRTFDTDGVLLSTFDESAYIPLGSGGARGIVFDSDGNFYVGSETGGVYAFQQNGDYIGAFGEDLLSPRGVAIGAAIVPEPISSILFVTGGTLLAGRRLMRKKRT